MLWQVPASESRAAVWLVSSPMTGIFAAAPADTPAQYHRYAYPLYEAADDKRYVRRQGRFACDQLHGWLQEPQTPESPFFV